MYWLLPGNLIASRRHLRADYSNEWRYALENANPSANRTVTFAGLLGHANPQRRFRFIIVGDTGEGDRSQYGLLPLMRGAQPHFMIVNGDVAYPAGRYDDFLHGFFEPYRDFAMPIWATAGNHEYYSKHHGKEFYDVFCSTTYAREWSQHGLKLVRQPGMYWELNDPTRTVRLVVIGLDSGKTGNLERRDDAQYEWLERRLTVADHRDQHVILLYHIPALVSQKHVKKIRLGELHRILLRHKSVRAVVCGHIHNHQEYAASTFEAYAAQRHGAGRAQRSTRHRIMSCRGMAAPRWTVPSSGSGSTSPRTCFRIQNGGPLTRMPCRI
jgi:hypothetical protein